MGASELKLGEEVLFGFEFGEVDFAQGGEAEFVACGFDLGASGGVLAGGDTAGFAGVAEDDGESGRNGDGGDFEGGHVHEEGVTGLSERAGGHVHEADGGANEVVFAVLGDAGEFFGGEGDFIGGAPEETEGDFEGGAAGDAGADGEVVGDVADYVAGDGMAVLAERPRHAGGVVGPLVVATGLDGVDVEISGGPASGADEAGGAVGGFGGDGDSVFDGEGEDKAAGVVGVFSDEVDASGGLDDNLGLASPLLFEEADGPDCFHAGEGTE